MKNWGKWLAAAGIPALVALFTLQGGEDIPNGMELTLVGVTISEKEEIIRIEILNAKTGDEILSMRNKNVKTFKENKGQLRSDIFAAPKHYLDKETMTYKDIDLTAYEVSEEAKVDPDRMFDKYVNAGYYKSTWFVTKPHDYTLYRDDYFLTFTALFDTTDIEIVTEHQNVGVKQSIILLNDKADTSYSWTISSNAIMSFLSGVTIFKDSFDKILFRIPQATAWDNSGLDIPVVVSLIDSTFTYKISVPNNAVYPITIDPSTNCSVIQNPSGHTNTQNLALWADARDTTLANGASEWSTEVNAYWNGGGYTVKRGYMTYDTSPLPDAAIIDSAIVHMYHNYRNLDSGAMRLWFAEGTYSGALVAVDWHNDFVGWAASGAYSITDLASAPINSTDYALYDTLAVKFNATGEGIIDLTGLTKFMILTNYDKINSAPAGQERLQFHWAGSRIEVFYSTLKAPTNFTLTRPDDTDSSTYLYAHWVNNYDTGIDSLTIWRDTGSWEWFKKVAKDDVTTVLSNLISADEGVFRAQVDSLLETKFSNSDVLYTYARKPGSFNWNFGGLKLEFSQVLNADSTEYAIRDSLSQKWVQIDGTLDAAKDWRTEPAWLGANITELPVSQYIIYGIVGKNGDGVETKYYWNVVNRESAIW